MSYTDAQVSASGASLRQLAEVSGLGRKAATAIVDATASLA